MAGPTTNEATSTVTSRSVARRLSAPAACGIAAASAGNAGVAQATARVALATTQGSAPRAMATAAEVSRISLAIKVARATEVPLVAIGQPADVPGQRDVRQHPGGAGEAHGEVVAGGLPHHDEISSGQLTDIASAANAWLRIARRTGQDLICLIGKPPRWRAGRSR